MIGNKITLPKKKNIKTGSIKIFNNKALKKIIAQIAG
jgi:hypothetical protein